MSEEQRDEQNHIDTVRRHLLDQMKALRSAVTPEEVERELGRSRGVSDLAQSVVNTAKVEVDYLKVTGQTRTPFFESPGQVAALPAPAAGGGTVTRLPGPGNGISSITRHSMGD